SREVGLDRLVVSNAIVRAETSQPWPGSAGATYSPVWICKGRWHGMCYLDGREVNGINALLKSIDNTVGSVPRRLTNNRNKSFIGSYVLGTGFIVTPETAQELIKRDTKNADVLFPYLTSQDLNSHPNHSASRWVINFFDWPLETSDAPNGYKGPC